LLIRKSGAVLAFPGFVYGLSCALVIAGAYIKDVYQGHYLIRNFTFKNMKATTVEWIFFLFFLGLPLIVMCFALLSRTDRWWEFTTLFWFTCVAFFYVLFTINVVVYEMLACWEVTKNKNKKENASWPALIRQSILSRQIHTYSGRRTYSYVAMGSIRDAEYTDSRSRRNEIGATSLDKISWQTKLTMWDRLKKWGLYESVTEEEFMFSIDDARDVRPFITSYTWSLEKVFCRPRNSRYIAIVRGPGALTIDQVRSSMACSIIGTSIMFLILVSILVYLSTSPWGIILILIAGLIVAHPSVRSTYTLYKTRKDLIDGMKETGKRSYGIEAGLSMDDRRIGKNESECVYFVQEVYRITRPTMKFCWLMFCLEFGIFFVYPLAGLFFM
jgi:hypothetical protein